MARDIWSVTGICLIEIQNFKILSLSIMLYDFIRFNIVPDKKVEVFPFLKIYF